jgi:NAD(P)-dependent dehydrogenase (short-subunit alcohol dehydrogenase family)
MKTAVITGVSTGIGFAAVKILIPKGFRVFGSVRSEGDADRLKKQFGEGYVPLVFDVTDPERIDRAAAQVREALNGETLGGLVNNAGITVAGPLTHLPVERFRYQLEVNLIGPMAVTQAFLPLLGMDCKRKGPPGRIINISSVAGRMAPPFIGAYSASKYGLEGYSDSLRRELMMFGIDVVLIEPGAVKTPIWEKGEGRLLQDFPDTPFTGALEKYCQIALKEAENGFEPEVIGELIYKTLIARRPKARYLPVPQRLINWTFPSRIPTRILDCLMAQALKIQKPD